jgi:hypothetical protein
LVAGGKLVLADISFTDAAAMEQFAKSIGELWEAEPYWLAADSIRELQAAGLTATYIQVSKCAGVYCLQAP